MSHLETEIFARRIAERNMDVDFQTAVAQAEGEIFYDQLLDARAHLMNIIRRATRDERSDLDGWIVCGSGLKGVAKADGVEVLERVDVRDIPHWFCPATEGHGTDFVVANIGGQLVGIQTGRGHVYDTDHSPRQLGMITMPLVVAKGLGVDWIVTTCAAGAIRWKGDSRLSEGDVAVIFDYVDKIGVNPLVGLHDERLGARFQGKDGLVDRRLFRLFEGLIPRDRLRQGIYHLADNTPQYEGVGDIWGSVYPELFTRNPDLVSLMGMSFSNEAAVILRHGDPPIDDNGFDRRVDHLGLAVITNVIELPYIPSIEGFLANGMPSPNPATHGMVLGAGVEMGQYLVPAVVGMCEKIT